MIPLHSPSDDQPDHPVDSFVFSEYIRCIGSPDIWDKYFAKQGIRRLDKKCCIESLNDARLARNSVMHFNRISSNYDPVPALESLAVWLRDIAHRSNSSTSPVRAAVTTWTFTPHQHQA